MSSADIGAGANAFGALVNAAGSYYSVSSEKRAARSQSMNLLFRSSIANLNARQAERQARSVLEAGRRQAFLASLQYGATKGQQRAALAASGARLTGSAAEKLAATEYAKQLDMQQIRANAVAQAGAFGTQAQDLRNQAALDAVSAGNIRRSAGTLSPWGAVLTGLIGSSGTLTSDWRRINAQSS